MELQATADAIQGMPLTVAGIWLCAFAIFTQTVAAIRTHAPDAPRSLGNGKMAPAGPTMSFSGSRATFRNISLDGLIQYAYDLHTDTVSGLPRWADSVRFDVAAKADDNRTLTRDEFRQIFQTLLAERFKLKFHLNTKPAPGYSLVVAKNGPKLAKSPPDAESSMKLVGSNYAEMTVSKWTMQQLATQLSFTVARPPTPVVDATGLTGAYDFKLKWADDQDPNADPTLPSLITALQDQLGLKLEPRKASTETLIIDNAERPSAN